MQQKSRIRSPFVLLVLIIGAVVAPSLALGRTQPDAAMPASGTGVTGEMPADLPEPESGAIITMGE